MQNPGPMLASASDTIKVWEADRMSILKQYSADSLAAGSSFKDVGWSTDNSKLAAVSNGSGIVLYDITDGAIEEVRVLPKSEEQTCVCFGNNKNEFFSGGATGDVNMWNFATHKLEKAFDSGHKSPVRRITKIGDGKIASACTSGKILIWVADSSSPQAQLKASRGKSIRGLGHSAWERSVLGTTSDDGIVCLWDIEKQAVKCTFSSHNAPSMDLSFSPINHLLLASCGLDKKIIFHDIHGSDVMTITSIQPVTAVCLLSNGVHVCAGTSMGSIFKYDLRKKSEPLNSISAHSTSVQRLVLETLKERTRKDKRSSKSEASNYTQRRPSRAKEGAKGPLQPPEKTERKLRPSQDPTKNRLSWSKVPELELPSTDHKTVNGDNYVHASPSASMPLRKSQIEKSYGLQTPLNKSNASSRRDTLGSYCEGIFSPVANMNESMQGDAFTSQSHSKPARSSRGYTSQGSVNHRPTFSYNTPDPKVNGNKEAQNSYSDDMETLESGPVSVDQIRGRGSMTENPLNGSVHLYSSTPTNPASNSASSLSPDSEAVANSKKVNSRNEETSVHTLVNGNHVEEGASASYQQYNFTQSNPFQYQLEFLQSTVRDLVEEHEDNIRDELRHLHMQMIKMFAKQNETIRQLAEQCSVNPLLLQEIERLRNENDRLRRKF